MVTRTQHVSVFALWLLTGQVLGQVTAQTTPSQASSALASTSTFVSPSLHQADERGLSESAKIGLSVGVTLASIILVGSIAIFCVIRRRRKALTRPETRLSGDIEDENAVARDNGPGKGNDVYYMSPASATHPGTLPQAPTNFVYEGGVYSSIPEQTYAPQQQPQVIGYPISQPGETYAYSGMTYPGTTTMDPTQQSSYAGPSNTKYHPEVYSLSNQYQHQPLAQPPAQQQQQQYHHQQQQQQQREQQQQQQQQQQQEEENMSWIYPVAATSPVEAVPAHDMQYVYLQDYQQPMQSSGSGRDQQQHHNGEQAPSQTHQGDTYNIPPPRPNASELPDQRKPVELMGEGHYKEAP